MSTSDFQSASPLQFAAKLPIRQRIAALGEAILVASPESCDEMAMMLIELASFQTNQEISAKGHQLEHVSASSPLELITRLPGRWRERHADEAMLALARAWSVLSTPMKELAAGLGRDRWLGVAERLSTDPDPRIRRVAVSIAHDTADPGFGKIVGLLLADEHQVVRKSADKAMMRMTMVMLDHLPAYLLGEDLAALAATPRVALPVDPAVLELERCILLAAIADAAWSFATHRCRSPLLAALLVMDRAVATPMEREISARMRRLLGERNHPSHSPMRTVLRRTPCPILRERAMRWVAIAPISSAAIDRLNVADSIDEHKVFLRKAYLGIRPKRADRLASLRPHTGHHSGRLQLSTGGALPEQELYPQLDEASRVGMLRMVSLVSIDDQLKRDLCEPMLADASDHVRFIACDSSSSIDLPDFLYDVDPAVARHGALCWSSAGHTPPKPTSPSGLRRVQVAKTNIRSPHSWVRRVAREELDRLSPINPASPASRSIARRMYKNDPAGFVRLVRDHLANPDARCDALMLIRIMGIEHRFELDLISIVQGEQVDLRAKATAVMAIGQLHSNSAHYMLSEALSDQDDRIRANACEVIDVPPAQLVELKADKSHRVRANAIRRVVTQSDPAQISQVRSGCQLLLEMLHDDRPMHRLAATWVAQRTLTGTRREQMGATWKPLVAEIQSLASGGQDPRVQARAAMCVHRIESDMQQANQAQIQSMNEPFGTEY